MKETGVNIYILPAILLLTCVFVGVICYTRIPFYTFLFPFLCIVILSVVNYRSCFKGSKWGILFVVIWIIKFIALCYHSVYKSLPMGGVDWIGFNYNALELLSSNESYMGILLSPDQSLLPKIVAIIYSIGGISVEVIYFYMFITSLLTQLYIYRIFMLLTGQVDVSQKICLLWMIWPIEFIFSITFLREMPIQFLFTVSFYQFLLFLKYNRSKCAIHAILLIMIAMLIHSGVVAVLFSYLLLWAIHDKRFRLLRISSGVALLLVALFSPLGEMLMHKFGSIENIEDVVRDPHQTDRANTTYMYIIPTDVKEFISQIPYRFIMFALSPLPWQAYDMPTFFAWLMDGVFQLFFLYKIIILLFHSQYESRLRMEIRRVLLLIFFGVNFVFSIGTADYGTAMRHRAKIFPIMMIFFIPLFETRNTYTYRMNLKIQVDG
jgi:hypothetical protein